jgi:hypothetical protein
LDVTRWRSTSKGSLDAAAKAAAPENVDTASWRDCSALKPMPVPACVMASKK